MKNSDIITEIDREERALAFMVEDECLPGWREVAQEVMDSSPRVVSLSDATRQFEKALVMRTLVATNGNACKAAELLGTHRNCIARRVSPHVQRKLRRIIKKRRGKGKA